jgi:hypothetical protein
MSQPKLLKEVVEELEQLQELAHNEVEAAKYNADSAVDTLDQLGEKLEDLLDMLKKEETQ